MRAFAFVLLSLAAVKADSDAYTIGQVASGLTNGGVVTGVDYSNGVVSGLGAIGNRFYAGHVGYAGLGHAGVGHLGYANQVVAFPAAYGYSGVVASPAVHGYSNYAGLGYGYAGHYGKREAEADSDAYTIGQVAAGLPVANAYATGHAHNVGVVTGTTYAAPAYTGYRSYAAPAYAGYRSYAAPAYAGYAGVGHVGYAAPAAYGYSGLGHRYGKREAEADSDAYTIGQVAAGLPVANAYANAYATGHAHNVGVVTGTTYSAPAYAGYSTYAAPTYAGRVGHLGYGGHFGYAGLGYSGLGYTGAYYG